MIYVLASSSVWHIAFSVWNVVLISVMECCCFFVRGSVISAVCLMSIEVRGHHDVWTAAWQHKMLIMLIAFCTGDQLLCYWYKNCGKKISSTTMLSSDYLRNSTCMYHYHWTELWRLKPFSTYLCVAVYCCNSKSWLWMKWIYLVCFA
jgi:hypothetical protein